MAITGEMYTGRNRAVALGVIGAAVEAGGALGPFLRRGHCPVLELAVDFLAEYSY